MKEYRNCTNCGAPLHYDETNYGSVAKCQYCGTEYHIEIDDFCDISANAHNKIQKISDDYFRGRKK